MKQFWVVAGAMVALLGQGACSTLKEIAEATGHTKVSMTLKNGQKIEGTMLQDENGHSLVQVSYGTVSVSTGDVMNVEKTGTAPVPTAGEGRLSRWDHCLHILAPNAWAKSLAQVPATVIDAGILKNVPYMSHRSGEFELNVYGDPDRPACLEIGLFRGSTNRTERQICMETMALLLTDPLDRKILTSMNLERGMSNHNGMIFEVTPPTEKDAYGGWWISVYDEKMLTQQRASDSELVQITITPSQLKAAASKTPTTTVAVHPSTQASSFFHWKEHELKDARPAAPSAPEPRIYKRGVYRKDGIYVVSAS